MTADELPRLLREVRRAGEQGRRALPEDAGKRLLAAAGMTVPRGAVVAGSGDLARAAHLTPPLVVKAVGDTLLHKSDAGGVVLGLADLAAVSAAIRQVDASVRAAGRPPERFLVEEQAEAGVELLLGAVRVAGRSWSVMIGLGGVWTEFLDDVGLRMAPLTRGDVRSLLGELRAAPLLRGARGSAPPDLDALEEQVLAFAGRDGLLPHLPDEVEAVDVNPLLVSSGGCVALDAAVVLRPVDPGSPAPAPVPADFGRLLRPRSVAVLGASARQKNLGNAFLAHLRAMGYDGRIHVVHPTAGAIDGHPAVRSLRDVPGEVDYAYVTLPARHVVPALTGLAGRVGFAQVISSGFGETATGAELESELTRVARRERVRVLGPNCLGTHSPSGRITFVGDVSAEPGGVAFVSQSGGLGIDVIRQGAARGIAFRAVVGLGNGADVRPAELVRHFLDDPETTVVGLYLESAAAGSELLEEVRGRRGTKPIILLAGGRTRAGAVAAASHTGAMAGNERLWPAIARQGAMVLVDGLGDLMDTLEAFRFPDALARPPEGDGVVLYGNGGGTSVLAADELARAGLDVPRLPEEVVGRLEALGLPPGNGLSNPIDVPAASMIVDEGRVARTIFGTVLTGIRPAAFITHVNVGVIPPPRSGEPDLVDAMVRSVAAARDDTGGHHLVVLRDDGRPETAERVRLCHETAHRHRLPVFAETSDAIAACRGLLDHHAGLAALANAEGVRR
jgi:acyl-CoA synthetase (NDP forming)